MSLATRAVRSEYTKVASTRMWWVLALVMIGYVGVTTAGITLVFGSGSAPDAVAEETLPLLVYSFAGSVGYVFPLLVGALAVTNEFRHQTLTPTFLAIPRRQVLLIAKLVVLFLVGGGFGVVGLLASVGVGAPILAVLGFDPLLGEPETQALILRVVLAMALWGAMGVGLGVLLPSQLGSVVVILAFTQFVEPLLRVAAGFADWAGEVGRFLPGAASDALVGASFYSLAGPGVLDALEWWQGALVLGAYVAVFSAIGYVTSWCRDVT